MSRAAFDVTVEFWGGPNSLFPGLLKYSGPGRFVPVSSGMIIDGIFNARIGYVTSDYPFPSVGLPIIGGGTVCLTQGVEDRIGIPALLLAPTPIMFVEHVAGIAGFPYVRCHIGWWY